MLRAQFIPVLILCGFTMRCTAQQAPASQTHDATVELRGKVEQLMRAMDATEARIASEQKQLWAMRQQLLEVQASLSSLPRTPDASVAAAEPGVSSSSATPEEQRALLASQISTLDQEKVESASKYPVRIHGTILLNGFINSQRVDQASAPSAAIGGRGSTGLSLRQTSLGMDATGPRLLGATSRADVNVDFFGTAQEAGYDNAGGLLRMRTAHAALDWKTTELFIAYDRPLISPFVPESLVASAVPELSWSGNLWSWNPQVGLRHTWGTRSRLHVESALIDVADPVYANQTGENQGASLAQSSRKLGVQARVALLGKDDAHSASVGIGGYFSPHRFSTSAFAPGIDLNAWAGTLDFRLPLGHGLSLTGTGYRGAALGGLGGGGYRDFVIRGSGAATQVRALDDVGGWAQLHQALGQRFTWNVGLGIDNPFVRQIRAFSDNGFANSYENIARNRTVFANFIYSPRAYLLFSAEYRNVRTAPVQGLLWTSHVSGVGAAYRF